MKKHLILALALLIFCSVFLSCNNIVSIKADDPKLMTKTTIKNFEHLKDPIVVSLSVSSGTRVGYIDINSSGNKSVGNIIAVIDTETDSVFDWIFYSSETTWRYWGLVQLSQNPVCYAVSSVGPKEVLILRPDKETLSLTKTNLSSSCFTEDNKGHYLPIYSEGSQKDYSVYLFDVLTNSVTDTIPIEFDYVAKDRFVSDEDGLYFVLGDSYNGIYYLKKYDYSKMKLSTLNYFNRDTVEEGDKTVQEDYYNVKYSDKDYVYVLRTPYISTHKGKIYIVDKKSGELKRTIAADTGENEELSDIFEVNGELYAVGLTDETTKITLYKINQNSDKAESLGVVLHFSDAEKIYVRGSKIYFMRTDSGNYTDIEYIWYDINTKKNSEIKKICVTDFVE